MLIHQISVKKQHCKIYAHCNMLRAIIVDRYYRCTKILLFDPSDPYKAVTDCFSKQLK